MKYSFTLEKYRGSHSRFDCPQCGCAKKFTRYIDTENGSYLDDSVGRCDREVKCGYHYKPREFFDDNPELGSRDSPPPKRKINRSVKIAEPKTFGCIDKEIAMQTLSGYEKNNFVKFLLSRFDHERVRTEISRYFIGTWHDARTIFWQIDSRNRIRTGKLIRFDVTTCKRDHRSTNWVHAQLKTKGLLQDNFELGQCFFGEHLLASVREKVIGIVESEKSAVIASICFPQFLWLACGGKSNLTYDKLNFIRHRKILLFPDGDAFNDWSEKTQILQRKGFAISVSDLIEQKGTAQEKEDGIDLADILTRLAECRNNVKGE